MENQIIITEADATPEEWEYLKERVAKGYWNGDFRGQRWYINRVEVEGKEAYKLTPYPN